MKQWIQRFVFFLVLIVGLFVELPRVLAQTAATVFTPETLSQYDGKNGHKAYFAYKGAVYDVTGKPNWKDGEHYGNFAGKDLTGMMANAPHGEEVLQGLTVVGTYGTTPTTAPATKEEAKPVQSTAPKAVPQEQGRAWYENRVRFLGISLLGWTGILLGVFFVLNFATCFALPWSQFPLPWKGSRPGPDPLDIAPEHMRWATIHKYFAWGTVIIGIVHGILGFMQMLGYTV